MDSARNRDVIPDSSPSPEEIDPFDDTLDRSRDVVCGFLDLRRKLEDADNALHAEIDAHSETREALMAAYASEAQSKQALKVTLSRLEESNAALSNANRELASTQEEVQRLRTVNTSIGRQFEAQRSAYLKQIDEHELRFAQLQASCDMLRLDYDAMGKHYLMTRSALDAAIQTHETYKMEVHSIQHGFERVIGMQQEARAQATLL